MPWKGAGNISTCRATPNARFAARRGKTLPPFQTASKRMWRNGFKNLKIYISLQKKKKKINLPYNCSCLSNVCFADSLSKTFSP
ncbi:hypothetical protein COH32_03100 [Neisseria meningitidis]|nr:hypothetical protein COI07_07145 [Neisseria meningitidis]RQL31675.1 hypothetical protein COH32_03100 [Neisseria meningitidis]